jgi:hypothetical protein
MDFTLFQHHTFEWVLHLQLFIAVKVIQINLVFKHCLRET